MKKLTATIRLAVVGTGFFSRFHYDAWKRLAAETDLRLVGVCSLDQREAEAVAGTFEGCEAFDDFETMLDALEPDLLDIVAGPSAHAELIEAVAKRRIHAICQKPFTGSLEEAERLVALAEAAGIRLIVHENFRFQPWYAKLRDLLEDGSIGEVYQASFRLRPGDGQGPDAYLDRQPYFRTMPRFLVHETLIHLIDVFRFLFGEMRSVAADLVRLNPAIAGEDAGTILCRFENGVRGLIDGNRLADHAAENRRLTMGEMLIEGAKGALRLDGDGRIFLRRFGENAETEIDYVWRDEGFGGDCVYRTQAGILDALRSGRPAANEAADYLENLRIEEAVYASNETGRRVTLAADGDQTP